MLTGEGEEVRVRKGVILGTGKKKSERSWGVKKKVGFRREVMGTGRKKK